MEKSVALFESWNKEKQKIHCSDILSHKFCHIWEIWRVHLGMNIWQEQDGDLYHKSFNRLVLVIATYGKNSDIVLWLPITKQEQKEFFGYCLENKKYTYFKYPKNYVVYTQIRALSKKRFCKEIWAITPQDLNIIIDGVYNTITKKGRHLPSSTPQGQLTIWHH